MAPLLLTKLVPPRLPHTYIVRQRLLDQLDVGMHGKLNLIHAPAGYGKTTLAVAWVTSQQEPSSNFAVAWFTVEAYDNDPALFLNYFIAAWQQIYPDFGQDVSDLLAAGQISLQSNEAHSLLNQLINELAQQPAPLALVLDDWHVIENDIVRGMVQYWIEHVPPHVHTLITSRELPQMPIARWRVRGQLNLIDAPTLQFTVAEVGQFLRDGVKLTLTDEDIVRVTAQTEGWIGALQLMALSLQGPGDVETKLARFSSQDRYLIAYLTDEVLKQQSDELQAFLMATAILDRFNVNLCNAVAERDDSQRLLDELESRNLFIIPLDTQGGWYRYHALLSNYLRQQLAANQPEQYRGYHIRAFNWLRKAGLIDEAIEHGLEAAQYDEVAQLLAEQANDYMWRYGRATSLFGWFQRLPEQSQVAYPKTALTLAWVTAYVAGFEELDRYLQRLRPLLADHLDDSEIRSELIALEAELELYRGNFDEVITKLSSINISDLENQAIQGMILQVQGFAHRLKGNATIAIEALKQAREYLSPHTNLAFWVYASGDLAEAHMIQGDLYAAERIYQEIMSSMPSEQFLSNPLLDFAWSSYGSLKFKRNQLNDAFDYVQRSIAINRAVGKAVSVTRHDLEMLARIRQAQGAWEDALELLDQIEALVARHPNPRVRFQTAGLRAHLYLLQGKPDEAAGWVADFEREDLSNISRLQLQTFQHTYARWLMHRDPTLALDRLATCVGEAKDNGWREHRLTGAVLQTSASQRLGEAVAALDYLRTAIELARPGGYLRVFVEQAVDIAPLLRELAREGDVDSFIGSIQAAFLPVGVTIQPLIDPLTEREIEILQLIGQGLSNPQIAERMIIATGTVARHTNNIFGKLNVRNRTEATLQARRLGLI